MKASSKRPCPSLGPGFKTAQSVSPSLLLVKYSAPSKLILCITDTRFRGSIKKCYRLNTLGAFLLALWNTKKFRLCDLPLRFHHHVYVSASRKSSARAKYRLSHVLALRARILQRKTKYEAEIFRATSKWWPRKKYSRSFTTNDQCSHWRMQFFLTEAEIKHADNSTEVNRELALTIHLSRLTITNKSLSASS